MLRRISKHFSFKIQSSLKSSSNLESAYVTNKIRNFGVIAHIDAGKTTTTERMLFYSGTINQPGEVHHGNTTTDFLPQERDRGITIQSAVASFDWKGFQMNLIDTPGHIDFTSEVERSLQVLDSAVLVLDSSQGVETQTKTVWKQAESLPVVAFANKIDKAGASLFSTLNAIKQKLNVTPLLLNFPNNEERDFDCLYDVISGKKLVFEGEFNESIKTEEFDASDKNAVKCHKLKEILLEALSENDDDILNSLLEGEEVPEIAIKTAIKKQFLAKQVLPVFSGSSLKNKGVQSILDFIIDYCPSPLEIKEYKYDKENKANLIKITKEKEVLGYVFKIINDKNLGSIAFTRLYEGIIKPNQLFFISNSGEQTKASHLLRMFADETVTLSAAKAGELAAILGSDSLSAGDTIVGSKENIGTLIKRQNNAAAIFFTSIYPKKTSDFKALIAALLQLKREDDSLSVEYNKETNQIVLGGLGELHLEVVQDRIRQEHNIETRIGKLIVKFKETVTSTYSAWAKSSFRQKGSQFKLLLEVEVSPLVSDEIKHSDLEKYFEEELACPFELTEEPPAQLQYLAENGFKFIKDSDNCVFVEEKNTVIILDFEDQIQQTEEGVIPLCRAAPYTKVMLLNSIVKSLESGPLQGYELNNVVIKVANGKISSSLTEESDIYRATSEILKKVLPEAAPTFLEPNVVIEVEATESTANGIISELTSKRNGRLLGTAFGAEGLRKDTKFIYQEFLEEKELDSEEVPQKIYAMAPLSNMVGYAVFLRSITKGEAKFIMKYYKHDLVAETLKQAILKGSYYFEN